MVFFDVSDEIFRIYELCMKASGVWPLDSNNRRSTIVFSITIAAQIVVVLTSLINPPAKCLLIELHHLHTSQIVSLILGVLNQIGLRVTCRFMVPLIKATINDWRSIIDPKERDIMERHNRFGTYIFCVLAVYVNVLLPGWAVCYSLFIERFVSMDERETCKSNVDAIWFNVLHVLRQIVSIPWKSTTIFIAMLFWSFAMHLSAQYNILKKQFQDFLLITNKLISRKEFRRLVDRHNQLLDLSGHLEHSFNVFVAIHVTWLHVVTCIMTYQLATDFEGLFSILMFRRLVNILFLFIGLYMYYYAGDYMTECAKQVGDVFTQCNWYNFSKESITDFSIVIARCQKPKTLTTANMYKLNLSNLKSVFNALYSYMTCIVSVVKAAPK